MLLVAGAGSCGWLVSCCWRGQQVLVSPVGDEGTVTVWVECGKRAETVFSAAVRHSACVCCSDVKFCISASRHRSFIIFVSVPQQDHRKQAKKGNVRDSRWPQKSADSEMKVMMMLGTRGGAHSDARVSRASDDDL